MALETPREAPRGTRPRRRPRPPLGAHHVVRGDAFRVRPEVLGVRHRHSEHDERERATRARPRRGRIHVVLFVLRRVPLPRGELLPSPQLEGHRGSQFDHVGDRYVAHCGTWVLLFIANLFFK